MTIEELQAALEQANASIAKLEAKNSDILGKLTKADERAQAAAQEAAEEARTANLSDLEKANKRAEKAEALAKAAAERAEESHRNLRTYREEAAIANVITSHKVQPDDVRAVKAIFKMELDRDSEELSIGGVSLEDWGKSYFAKEGKKYTAAADHTGGGASGSGGAKAARMNKDNFNFTDFAKIQLENPAEANAIADAVGRPGLKTPL